jgi:hypothetical protein
MIDAWNEDQNSNPRPHFPRICQNLSSIRGRARLSRVVIVFAYITRIANDFVRVDVVFDAIIAQMSQATFLVSRFFVRRFL